jgi:protein-S-isoprenylcysteine O-methyltransferase Ste14
MNEASVFRIFLIISFVVATGIFIALFFVSAPYGRHSRRGWGLQLPNWTGWLLMESVSAIVMLAMFLIGDVPKTLTTIIFLLMWEAHYIHRSYIYPFLLRDGKKKMPITVIIMAVAFNLGNGYLNGRYIFHFSGGRYSMSWLLDPRFIVGTMLFIGGFIINRWADNTLRGLRKPGETGYKVPYGGLYEYISCPNYLGEILEWFGWAIATWSLPGLTFAIWTFANLVPRAWSHHKWYHDNFSEYPLNRKALIPGIW